MTHRFHVQDEQYIVPSDDGKPIRYLFRANFNVKYLFFPDQYIVPTDGKPIRSLEHFSGRSAADCHVRPQMPAVQPCTPLPLMLSPPPPTPLQRPLLHCRPTTRNDNPVTLHQHAKSWGGRHAAVKARHLPFARLVCSVLYVNSKLTRIQLVFKLTLLTTF